VTPAGRRCEAASWLASAYRRPQPAGGIGLSRVLVALKSSAAPDVVVRAQSAGSARWSSPRWRRRGAFELGGARPPQRAAEMKPWPSKHRRAELQPGIHLAREVQVKLRATSPPGRLQGGSRLAGSAHARARGRHRPAPAAAMRGRCRGRGRAARLGCRAPEAGEPGWRCHRACLGNAPRRGSGPAGPSGRASAGGGGGRAKAAARRALEHVHRSCLPVA